MQQAPKPQHGAKVYSPLRVHNIALAEINIIFRRVRRSCHKWLKSRHCSTRTHASVTVGAVFGTLIEGVMIVNRLDSSQGWVFKLLGEG